MKSVALFGGIFWSVSQALIPCHAHSGEMLLDSDRLIEADRLARTNSFRLQAGLISRKLDSFDLGKPVTPYFTDQSDETPKRRYRKDGKCFEVSFLNQINHAVRISCDDLVSDLRLPGFSEYFPVSVQELAKSGLNDFVFRASQSKYKLKAFLHSYDTVEMDRRDLGLGNQQVHPTQDFSVTISNHGQVNLDSKLGLIIRQNHQIHIGNIGIQDEQSSLKTNEISAEPSAMVFYNGKGNVILVNRLLMPSAFQFYFQNESKESSEYFKNLQNRSYTEAVCYRDDWVGPSQKDCSPVAFEGVKTYQSQSFVLLKIDFVGQAVSVLK
jgi:hypothetical protein